MDVNVNDLLLALGEKTAEVFILRRRVDALERHLADINAAELAKRQPTPIQPVADDEGVAV